MLQDQREGHSTILPVLTPLESLITRSWSHVEFTILNTETLSGKHRALLNPQDKLLQFQFNLFTKCSLYLFIYYLFCFVFLLVLRVKASFRFAPVKDNSLLFSHLTDGTLVTLSCKCWPRTESTWGVIVDDTTVSIAEEEEHDLKNEGLFGGNFLSSAFGTIAERLSSFIRLSLVEEQLWKDVAFSKPVTLLVSGPSGSGKSFVIGQLSARFDIEMVIVTPSLIYEKFAGKLNQGLDHFFQRARQKQPCLCASFFSLFFFLLFSISLFFFFLFFLFFIDSPPLFSCFFCHSAL
jgi:hypothetical protein